MTHEQYEVLSNQAVAACAVVYFLAVLAHLAEWAFGRRVDEPVTAQTEVSVGAGGSASDTASSAAATTDAAPDESERMEMFGRIGVSTELAVSLALLYLAVTFVASLPGGLMYALQPAPQRILAAQRAASDVR